MRRFRVFPRYQEYLRELQAISGGLKTIPDGFGVFQRTSANFRKFYGRSKDFENFASLFDKKSITKNEKMPPVSH